MTPLLFPGDNVKSIIAITTDLALSYSAVHFIVLGLRARSSVGYYDIFGVSCMSYPKVRVPPQINLPPLLSPQHPLTMTPYVKG